MKKRVIRILLIIVGIIVLFVLGLLIFLTTTEYKPDEVQAAEKIILDSNADAVSRSLTITSWNIGYGGLGKESDFFLDGGNMVDPPSLDIVKKNIDGVENHIKNNPSDIWLIQEIDVNSSRSGFIDEFEHLQKLINGSAAFTYNHKCAFVPFPIPPIGKVEAGLATFSSFQFSDPTRISLPCPFSWPMRTANLKRCLLVTRMPVENCEKELVVINLHLEAYDGGEGRFEQTKKLVELMQVEYEKGNYVIAGGDFNQTFPGMIEKFPLTNDKLWSPNIINFDILNKDWKFAFDNTAATCRSLDQPYNDDVQLYSIDGFILSPNIRLESVKVEDLGFEFSDHNPLKLEVTLLFD